jgi:hypothetical protein
MDWSQIIVASISATATILSVILGKIWVSKKNKQKICDPIISDVEISTHIETCLDLILSETGSDRAYVMQFHNGGYYRSGKSQQKFSCTHEVCTPGTSKECHKSQNHLISNFNKYISILVETGSYSYTDIQSMPDDSLKNLVTSKGVKSILNIPIKSLDGQIIGILGIDFVKEIADPIFIHFKEQNSASEVELIKFLKNEANIIAAYLI